MTLGEILSYRKLNQDDRGYVTGQHGARMWGPRNAQLTYIDHNGFLVMMPCALDDHNVWYPMGRIIHVSAVGTASVYLISSDFSLSDAMLRHLDHALVRSG